MGTAEINNEDNQRTSFKNLLFELSKNVLNSDDKSHMDLMYIAFEKLYWDESTGKTFRHFYTDIFSVLAKLQKDPSKGNTGTLGYNLRTIYLNYLPNQRKDKNGKPINVSDCIRKLYDHVSLDIARIDYSDQGDWKLSQSDAIQDLQTKVKNLNSSVSNIENKEIKLDQKIKKSKKNLENVKREYIAILGIFASIVLAFVTGITFTTATIKSLNIGNIYRVLIVVLLVGLVLINMLYALFYYLDRLVHNPTKGSIKPLIISNAVMVILIAGVIGLWHIGFVETHNKNVYAQQYDQIQSSTEKSKEKHK